MITLAIWQLIGIIAFTIVVTLAVVTESLKNGFKNFFKSNR